MKPDPATFASHWIDAWNSHDIDRTLSHYADDCEITTPMIQLATGINTGTLQGKENIRSYWSTALEKMSDLHFELVDVVESIESIALYYRSVMGKMAIEVMFFNANGEIDCVIAHYR